MQIRREMKTVSNPDRVDAGFHIKKAVDSIEDMRKEVSGVLELLGKLICARWVQDSLNDSTTDAVVRGKEATGLCNVKPARSTPKPSDTENWNKLMTHLGVSGDALKYDLMRPSWRAMVDYVAQELANGRPVPPGMQDKEYPVYKVVYRAARRSQQNA